MKQRIIWILALAATAFPTTLHAQRAVPDSLMFEGINLFDTCYDEIVASLGEPDEYYYSPSTDLGDTERFIYHFPGPDVLLGEGGIFLVIYDGFLTDLSIRGGQNKLFTNINGGVGPGDPIGWFVQNNFTLGPPEQTIYPGVNERQIIFDPETDGFRIWEANGVVVALMVIIHIA